jgi:HK97 family phage prohead protease
MSDYLVRSFASDFEIREEGDGHTLTGVVIPYDETYDVGEYKERFVRGAFQDSIAKRDGRISLFMMHDDVDPVTYEPTRAAPIGKAQHWNDSAEGLIGKFRVAGSVKGEEALALVRSEVFSGFSINFREHPRGNRTVGDVVERHKAYLRNVSLTDQPAYLKAKVLSLRAHERTETGGLITPKLNTLRAFLDTL